jgi:integrase
MARGKDRLYRRNGILCFRYKDVDGTWKEKSTGERDREQARDVKKDFDKDLEAGALPNEISKQTVEQACTRWVAQHQTTGDKGGLQSLHGRKCEASYLRQLVKRLGNRKLKSITVDTLIGYQSSRLTGTDGSRPVKGRPINCELGILVNVLKKANLWKGDLLKHYRRLPEGEERVGNALTATQKQLLEEVAASREEWTVAYLAEMLAVNTGMRGAEIKKLRLRHADLDNRRLTIEDAKTEAGNRTVELNQSAFSAVTKLWVRAQQLGASELNHYLLPADLSRHTKPTDPLKGQYGFDVERHQESWSTAWRNLRAAAVEAIKDRATKEERELSFAERVDVEVLSTIGFHSMRRTFITSMAERNVPLPVTRAMVGHMNQKTTELYTFISSNAQRQAVELLDREVERTPFVDVFVDKPENLQSAAPKSLN